MNQLNSDFGLRMRVSLASLFALDMQQKTERDLLLLRGKLQGLAYALDSNVVTAVSSEEDNLSPRLTMPSLASRLGSALRVTHSSQEEIPLAHSILRPSSYRLLSSQCKYLLVISSKSGGGGAVKIEFQPVMIGNWPAPTVP